MDLVIKLKRIKLHFLILLSNIVFLVLRIKANNTTETNGNEKKKRVETSYDRLMTQASAATHKPH